MPARPILSALAVPVLAGLVLAGPVAAQDAQTPPVAAARLPDAFAVQETAPAAVVEAEQARVARAETALRAHIAALQSGEPAYDRMTEGLAEAIRPGAAQVSGVIGQFGDLRDVTHAGVENGAELFLVTFENQATQWVIGLDEEGRAGALLFRPAPVE